MKKRFKWLNITQFTGAFNDNAFKMTAVIILAQLIGADHLPTILAVCSALFVVPFILFSNAAGTLADRFSKQRIICISKWAEVGVLLISIPALLSGLAWPLYVLLFLLCSQSALFGPAKRGIVPELVDEQALPRANGYLTAATYAAIILGTALPALLIGWLGYSPFIVIAVCTGLAAIGTWTAHRIGSVPAQGKQQSISPWIIPDVVRAVRHLKSDRWARLAVLGLVFFGGLSALVQQALVLYGHEALGLSVEKSPILFPVAAVGIGIGALLTGYFSKHTVEVGLIPMGALGIMISVIGLSIAHQMAWVITWIMLLGLCCGLFLVPLNAFLQHRIPAERRGEIFGATAFMSFSAMVLASGCFALMTRVLNLDARTSLFITGLASALPFALACIKLPGYITRFWLIRLTRRLYRIRFHGLDNLPQRGGALLICNHTAYADALLLQAATGRPIRFIMSRDIFKKWKWAYPFFKLTDCIPIHTSDGRRALAQSLSEARKAMEDGAIVGIFPEGALTTNGTLMKFNKGFEKIARRSGCPIIPAYIGNIWGSIFSFKNGNPGFRRPDEFPRRVTVRFGRPLPDNTPAAVARQRIEELGAEDAVERSLKPRRTLSHTFIKKARRNWFRPIASDTLGGKANYGKLLTSAILLARRLKPCIRNQKNVGICLPTSLGSIVSNLALTLSGKTVVNLNWTASGEALESAIKQARLKYIITSRRFEQKSGIPALPARRLYLEELLKNPGPLETFRALRAAWFASPAKLAGGREPQPSDVAAIIFSSGTTGTPKGVMLSHANLLSNVEATQAVQSFDRTDRLCALLPIFHAFGYLGLFWWPMIKGIPTVYHPNPLQAGRVVRLIREEKLTALLATPTFLQSYMRKAAPADFTTLRTVITGGERLNPDLADRFEERFSIRPMEGYGCTELSPVALLSRQQAFQRGCTGQPLPGIAVRITHPESGEVLPDGEQGLLWIKGPNVMRGYLNQPEKTAEVVQNGWYKTGDLAEVDQRNFVRITGRLSRFSKIAGEMIPHGAVEEALQHCTESESACVAVIGLKDQAKGEQLAVCYTDEAGDPKTLIARLRKNGLPNLWIPRPANFIRIPALPLLGTGKLDLQTLNNLVNT